MTRRAPSSSTSQAGLGAACQRLGGGERSEDAEQVGGAFGVAGLPVLGQLLQVALDLGQRLGVEQLAELGLTEQLGEERGVEGEGGGAAFGERAVALVDEGSDVAEEQAAGEG